jgi:dTDP-4-amino-4,6-dideoxygalactose transaminase
MHIRLNIPPWSGEEWWTGLSAMASAEKREKARCALREALRDAVPGRRPVLLSSARGALALWAQRRGLGGKRAAVPAYVCPAVVSGLREAGVEPVYVDVEENGFRFDREALAAAVRGGVSAVVAPSTYGLPRDADDVLDALGVPWFDDAAYLAGRRGPGGDAAGGGGDGGAWSFSFKALTGPGGGILWLPPEEVEAIEREGLPKPAQEPRKRFYNYVLRFGMRHRLPKFLGGAGGPKRDAAIEVRAALASAEVAGMAGVQAAVARVQWERREEIATFAAARLAVLRDAARELALFDECAGGGDPVHFLPLLVRGDNGAARRHRLRVALHLQGVQTEDPYPVPGDGAHPHAQSLAERLLLLPCGAGLTEANARFVRTAMRKAAAAIGVKDGIRE